MDEKIINDVSFVSLAPSGWKQYKQLQIDAFSSDPEAFSTTFKEAITYPDSHWEDKLTEPNRILLFAKYNEQLIGMVGAHLKREDGGDVVVITGMYVKKRFRGQGIARKLLEEMQNAIDKKFKAAKMKLWVCEAQKPAIGMYQQMGFVEVGRKEDAIENEEGYLDEIIMEKKTHE